jgi:hypothetical protein
MARAKYFELLDFTKFAYPSVVGMDAAQTSFNLAERLQAGGFMSYSQIWPRLGDVVSGRATESYIAAQFRSYSDAWKNENIQNAVRLLAQHFGGRGTWYPVDSKPKKVLGFWFKPSIKGVWFVEGQAYAVLINARKLQALAPEHLRFLARGIYELHCIEDPNDPIPLVVDLSAHEKAEGRLLRPYRILPSGMISFDEFDDAVRSFVKALEMAGVARPADDGDNIIDLFKKK